jgi:hypothetical protein
MGKSLYRCLRPLSGKELLAQGKEIIDRSVREVNSLLRR